MAEHPFETIKGLVYIPVPAPLDPEQPFAVINVRTRKVVFTAPTYTIALRDARERSLGHVAAAVHNGYVEVVL